MNVSRCLALGLLCFSVACGGSEDDPAQTNSSTTAEASSSSEEGGESGEASSGDSGEDTGEGSGDDTGDESSFLNVGDNALAGVCDVVGQDCPDGEKCTPYVKEPGACCVDAVHCQPVTGEGVMGDTCTRDELNDDCAGGFFCMTKKSGDTGMGVCLPLCDANANDCEMRGAPGADCNAWNDGVLPICQAACDPNTQDCDSGMGCYAAGSGFICSPIAAESGKGQDGDECVVIQGCNPGLMCSFGIPTADCAGDQCCTPWCDTRDPNPCEGDGEECVAYFDEDPLPGKEFVGMCAVPE